MSILPKLATTPSSNFFPLMDLAEAVQKRNSQEKGRSHSHDTVDRLGDSQMQTEVTGNLPASSSSFSLPPQTRVAPGQPPEAAAPRFLYWPPSLGHFSSQHASAVWCPASCDLLICLYQVLWLLPWFSDPPPSTLSLPQHLPHCVSSNCCGQPLVPTILLVAQLIHRRWLFPSTTQLVS